MKIILYHGSPVKFDKFEIRNIDSSIEQDGPGVYLTTSEKEAYRYSEGNYIYKVEWEYNKILNDKEQSKQSLKKYAGKVKKAFSMLDKERLDTILSNWGENPLKAFNSLIETCIDSAYSEKDIFMNVWAEGYMKKSIQFCEMMTKLGYDGHIVKFDGIDHIIAFNPSNIKILEVKQMIKESIDYKRIIITALDQEDTLEDLLTAIKDIGNTGHSFDILVDPKPDWDKNPNHGEGDTFNWDGDGSDQIRKIEVEKMDEEEYYAVSTAKKIIEDITLDIDKGDTILTGRFKNHKVEVKDIGTDEHHMPTVNGKQITKIRIPKLEESFINKILKESKFPDSADINTVLNKVESFFNASGSKTLKRELGPNREVGLIQVMHSDFKNLNDIFKNVMSMGWYPAAILADDKRYKFNKKSYEKVLKSNFNKAVFSIEKYYDNEEHYKTLWHVTPIERWEKLISKQGLTPHSQSKISTHPKRVYMMTQAGETAENLAEQLYDNEKGKLSGKYVLLKIDMTKLPNIKVYDDPDYNSGVYTYSSIPVSAIKVIDQYDFSQNQNADIEKILSQLLRN